MLRLLLVQWPLAGSSVDDNITLTQPGQPRSLPSTTNLGSHDQVTSSVIDYLLITTDFHYEKA